MTETSSSANHRRLKSENINIGPLPYGIPFKNKKYDESNQSASNNDSRNMS